MASDNINQVGKYIKNTRKKTEYALKRYKPDVPRIERVRDVFDPTNSFSMSFDIKPGEDQTLLDLTFNKPPPLGACDSECLQSACEQFLVEAGNHFITLSQPYNPTSIRVYDNNVAVDQANIDETDPAAGQFFVQGLQGLGIVVVCYLYSDPSCDFPDVFPTCPDLDIAHATQHVGLAPVFVDRFDRTVTQPTINGIREPSSGCGYWTGNVSGTSTSDTSGAVLNNAIAHMENDRVLGDQWEVVVAGRITNPNGAIQISVVGALNFSAFISYATGQLSMLGYFRFDDPDNPDPDFGDVFGTDSFFKTIPFTKIRDWGASGSNPIKYFARFSQVNPGGWFFKIWKQDEDEPTTFDMELSAFDVVPNVNETNITLVYTGIYTVAFTLTGLTQAVAIWGEPGQSRGDHEALGTGDGITGYSLNFCRAAPMDGFTRFGFCSPVGTPSTVTVSTGGSEFPSYTNWFSWPSFVDGPGLSESGGMVTSRVPVLGRPLSVRVKGEFQVSTFVDRTWAVVFQSYGLGQPALTGERFGGTTIGNGTSGGNDVWVDFDITVPCFDGGDGHYYYHWGIELASTNDQIVATLPRYEPPFLFANNAPIQAVTKNLETFPNGLSDCQAGNFCPDTAANFDARCGPVNNGNISVPYFCADIGETSSINKAVIAIDGDGRQVYINREQSIDISTNILGEMTFQYRANGVGTETIGTRCKKNSSTTFNGITTVSNQNGSIIWPTPFDCINGVEAYLELFIPNLPPALGGEIRIQEIDLGGQDGGPLMETFLDSRGSSMDFVSTDDSSEHDYPFFLNDWTAIRYRMADDRFKIKFWVAGTSEPSDWNYDLGLGFFATNVRSWGLFFLADGYTDESMYFKIRNLNVASIPGIVPPSYTGGSNQGTSSGSGSGINTSPTPPTSPIPPPPTGPTGAGRILYISPTGNDSGNGSISSPWATIYHAIPQLMPGDTLYCRGGTYNFSGVHFVTLNGTASAPINIQNAPGEIPVFDGGSIYPADFLYFSFSSYVNVYGLRVQGGVGPTDSDGSSFFGLVNSSHHIILDHLVLTCASTYDPGQHVIYIASSGVHDITIRNGYYDGNGSNIAGLVHFFHDPNAHNVTVTNNTFVNCPNQALVVWADCSGVVITNNTFNNNHIAFRHAYSSGTIFSNNTGTGNDIPVLADSTTNLTQSGNTIT